MTVLHLPDGQPLTWYLAEEERVARAVERYPDGAFFLWRVAPTVICGRHQVLEQEVNMEYCRAHNIAVVRRKSGGGCVYADRGNIMLSHIVPNTHPDHVFQTYLDTLARALCALGLPAVKTAHNDVLVGDRKVSGNACYALPAATIVHGTLLWDVDFDAMTAAITPPPSKLEKHGVASVRQRVANLRDLLSTSPDITSVPDILALCSFLEHTFASTHSESHLPA